MKRTISFLAIFVFLTLILFVIFYIRNTTKVRVIPSVSRESQIPQISLITPTPSSVFGKVIKVIDGDTIEIEGGQNIRYIGMNTPEMETSECFATEASQINKNLVLGKSVKLVKDISETDKYGRLLRYVHLGSVLINDELVKEGAAKIMTVPPDVKYKDEFLSSQNYARENNLGLWGKCN